MEKFFSRLPVFTLWRLSQVEPEVTGGVPEEPQKDADKLAKSGQGGESGQVCTVLESVAGSASGPSPMTGTLASINPKGCDWKPKPPKRAKVNKPSGNTLVNFIPQLGEMEKRLESTKRFPSQLNRIISEEAEANRKWFEQEEAAAVKLRELEQKVSELWAKQQAAQAVVESERKLKPRVKSLVGDCPRYTHVALLGVKHGGARRQKRLPRHPTSPRQRADYLRPLQLQKGSAEETKKQTHRALPKHKVVLLSPIKEAPIELRVPHVGGFDENYKQRVNLRPVAPGQQGRFPVLPPEPDWF